MRRIADFYPVADNLLRLAVVVHVHDRQRHHGRRAHEAAQRVGMELLWVPYRQLHDDNRVIVVLGNKVAGATVTNIGVQLRHPGVAVVPLVADPGQSADLRGVKGLIRVQLEACKARGAIIDKDATVSSS